MSTVPSHHLTTSPCKVRSGIPVESEAEFAHDAESTIAIPMIHLLYTIPVTFSLSGLLPCLPTILNSLSITPHLAISCLYGNYSPQMTSNRTLARSYQPLVFGPWRQIPDVNHTRKCSSMASTHNSNRATLDHVSWSTQLHSAVLQDQHHASLMQFPVILCLLLPPYYVVVVNGTVP